MIQADVRILDIMDKLDLDSPPEGFEEGDTIELEVTIDEADVIDDRDEPEEQKLGDILDETDIRDLAAAIRRGDTTEAELMLDRLTSADDTVTGWVQLGRYSRKARAPAEALRKAA